MKKKIALLVLLSVVVVGLITTSSVLGYVAYQKNDDVKNLKQQVEDLGLEVEEDKDGNDIVTNTNTSTDANGITTTNSDDDTTGTCPETLTFTDTGMQIAIDYPISWTPVQNLEISSTVAADDAQSLYGPVAGKYEIRFTKSGATLFFSKILGGVGGITMPLQSATHNYYILPNFSVNGSQIARYQEIGGSSWSYAPVTDCAANLPEGETSDVNVCVDPFIPNFGMPGYAAGASISNASAELLLEADEILKSAINN